MRPVLRVGLAALALSGCIFIPVVVPVAPTPGSSYICADGAKVLALYATDGEQQSVALTFDNQTLTLLSEPVASGARYGWPSDGTNYVWLTKGDEASLWLKDGSKGGAETVVHSACLRQN